MSEQAPINDQLSAFAAPNTEAPATNQETSETNQESQALTEGQEAPKAAPVKEAKKAAEIKKQLRKLKLKVDNREFEEEIPFDVEENSEAEKYLVRQLQMAKMGQKRAQEKSELEQQVVQFINDLRTNPRKALSDPSIGIDVKNLAKQIIEEEIENMQKSPEQLAKEKIEAELKSLKEEREKEKKDNYTRELQRLEQQEFERYDMLVSKALDEQKLPRNPYIVKKMADMMLVALEGGINAQPEQVAKVVKDEMMSDLRELMNVLPEDALEEYIGKDILNKIRKRRVEKVKAAPSTPIRKAVQDVGGKKEEAKPTGEKKSYKDFFGI